MTLNTPGQRGYVNWDEQDGFYYDVIKRPDGSTDYSAHPFASLA
jgi:hypothetical protein